MIQRTLLFAIILLITFSVKAASLGPDDIAEAKKQVDQLHQVSAEHMFCSARGERGLRWERGGDPAQVLPEMSQYLSNEMLRLFAWAMCGKPEHPKLELYDKAYNWDFRYGLSETESTSQPSRVKNLKIYTPKAQNPRLILAKVSFNFYLADDATLNTAYTLIREDGLWKIDDIALKGYSSNVEEILPGSRSLKTELQAAYKRGEAKCLQDPKCKTKMGK